MSIQSFYSITVKQFVLRCGHSDWLLQTQFLYNQVIQFYYQIFLKLEEQGEEIHVLNGQQAMRRLEILSIKGRDKTPVPYPLPYKKVPLYFRRAAINTAVAAAKGCASRGLVKKVETADILKSFHCAVTFYKGAYRELTEHSIQLKVWTGQKWTWLSCRLSGNSIPIQAEVMSPSLIIKGNKHFLNVPVKEAVQDGSKAKERFEHDSKVCSIQFTNEDTMAAAVILNHKGEQVNVKFFRGGAEYTHRCRQILEKISSSERKMGKDIVKGQGNEQQRQPYNQKYWMKLKNLSEYYAHNCSKQIIDFCLEQQVKVLILPEYTKNYTSYVMRSVGNWSPIHLSNRIRSQLSYKAWKAGIVMLEVNVYGCSNTCSLCHADIHKKGNDFLCENGHQGNRYLNTARNLGRKCLKSFEK